MLNLMFIYTIRPSPIKLVYTFNHWKTSAFYLLLYAIMHPLVNLAIY